MNPFLSLLICTLLFTPQLVAQKAFPKLDLYTQRELHHAGPEKKFVHLFVKGDTEKVKGAAMAVKGNFKYGYKGISAVEIPISRLDEFLTNEAIIGVESGETRLVPLLDEAIVNNCVLPVHHGDLPLNTPYKGDGVVMGIIDYGIDFAHEDFKKSNGNTRIRYLWDQLITTAPQNNRPQPYNYGREWTQYDIDAGNCTHYENPLTTVGHGTTVSGIAAGNGRATGQFIGMAPHSELIVVAFNWDRPFLATFVDAVDYIFKKADAMGKPCVINASLGTYTGSRDGRDFASLIVDGLLEERNGRVLVAAAGNTGNVEYHLGYEVTSDTSFTWFKRNASFNDVFFELWSDTAEFNKVYFSFGADDPASWAAKGKTEFYNVLLDYDMNNETTAQFAKNIQLEDNGTPVATIFTTLNRSEGRYSLQVYIPSPPSSYYWRLNTTGSGRIDVWSDDDLFLRTSDMVKANQLPSDSILPEIVYYKAPDRHQTIVSSYTTSDKVIAVGNYENRINYIDVDSCQINLNVVPGMLSVSSSHGPSRDGRIKPDISATGSSTLASGNAAQVALSLSTSGSTNCAANRNDRVKVAVGGKHFRNGGTSMASPVVAGIAALYLQKNPNASYREVKDAIILSAVSDTLTGITPNNDFGYGKVCGFKALQMDLRYGCTDSTAVNFDTTANMDDGSCFYDTTVTGCTDTDANNFNPAANTDDGTCTYDSIPNAIRHFYIATTKVNFYPNPFKENTRIVYEIDPSMAGKAQIIISNLLGQDVDWILLNNASGELDYNFPEENNGVYIYRLLFNSEIIVSDKVIRY